MGCLCSSKKPKKAPKSQYQESSIIPINIENKDIILENQNNQNQNNQNLNQQNLNYQEQNYQNQNYQNQNKIQENNDLLDRKRNDFINNFLVENIGLNPIEKANDIFITHLNKKMQITKDSIIIEEDLILKANLDSPNSYYNNFWINLETKMNNIISKEIYIDDMIVNDSLFESKDSSIKLEFEKMFNGQTRKIKIIQKIKNQFDNFCSHPLLLYRQGIATKFLIYLDNDLNLDDISNKNYTINKELNLAYFEGITTNETENYHGYINYSKKINYIIYRYIPELSKDSVQNIIRTQEQNKKSALNFIVNYKKVVITDYGQDIEEINLMKISNYKPGQYLSNFSLGFYKDTKNEVDLVELNGKPYAYNKIGDSIEFNNIKCYNNQFIEVHLKYKYFTNEEKDIYRQENVLLSNLKNTYCKSIVQIPDNYIIIATKDIFQRSPEIKNSFFYEGIPNEEKISEIFKFCFEKARWEIENEYILEANNNINHCEFSLNKIYKGGNLNEIKYDITKDGAELIDSGEKYIFKYNNLNTNRTKINFNIIVENSTSNYYFNENQEYLTQIPPEELQFFTNLVNQIISSDKTNFPNYKKIGKWVHNYIKYNLALTGAKFTAMEIYNNRQGVCEHFTKLYNTLLTAYGIEAIKVSGFAKDITEFNTKVKKNEKDEGNKNKDPTERHAWTLAKIDGEWVPLDATWDLFDKCVPITHVFENYGDGGESIKYNSDNQVKFKRTKENVKFIKN